MANIKSQVKRIKTNEKARLANASFKSSMKTAIKAVETIDECLGKVLAALEKVNGQMFVCADHGNSDQLVDYSTGQPFTAHTTNPVPFVLVNADAIGLKENGKLCDIAPTLLEMMNLEQPAEMTGQSLLIK